MGAILVVYISRVEGENERPNPKDFMQDFFARHKHMPPAALPFDCFAVCVSLLVLRRRHAPSVVSVCCVISNNDLTSDPYSGTRKCLVLLAFFGFEEEEPPRVPPPVHVELSAIYIILNTIYYIHIATS